MSFSQMAQRIGMLLILALATWNFSLRLSLIDDRRVDIGGAEINVIYGVQKLLLGRPLYEDPEKPPFDVMQYTPAYYGLCAAVAQVLGVDSGDTVGLFTVSRVLSLMLNLLTCLMVWRLCRSLSVGASFSFGVAALSFLLFTEHFYSRVDPLYALLFVGSMFALVHWSTNGRLIHLVIAALLATLCVFTKQTGVLLMGIITVQLAVARKWRALAWFSALVLVFIGIGLLLMLQQASWDVLMKNVVQGIGNGTSGTMYKLLFTPATYKYYAPLHLFALFITIKWLRNGDNTDRLLAVGLACCYAFGLLAGLKHGSDVNYLWEAHLITLVAAARWLERTSWRWRSQASIALLIGGGLFGLYRTHLLQVHVGSVEDRRRAQRAYAADLHVRDVLVGDLGLRKNDKVFITYRGHLELLLNGQSQLSQKDLIEWSVDPLFDYNRFYSAMDHGEVRYVVHDGSVTDTLRIMSRVWGPLDVVREVDGRWICTLPRPGE